MVEGKNTGRRPLGAFECTVMMIAIAAVYIQCHLLSSRTVTAIRMASVREMNG